VKFPSITLVRDVFGIYIGIDSWVYSLECRTNVLSEPSPYEIMRFRSKKYWVSGLCPSSGILNARKHSVSKTASVSILR
jgi:hypothetical protein